MRCAVIVFLALGWSQDHVAAEEQRSAAAEEDELEAGVRVRVSTPDVDKITGRIEKLTAATLLIKLDGESRSISVPFVELTKIEVSRGRRSFSGVSETAAESDFYSFL